MVGGILLLSVIFVLLVGLVSAFIFLPLLFVKETPQNLPKGNMGWPIIGETLSFLKPHRSDTIGSFLQDHCSRYGNIFKSHLFGHPTIVSCDPELNMFILQNEDKLFECSYPNSIPGVLGDLSLLCIVGDHHKRIRNFAINLANTCKSKIEYINDVETMTLWTLKSWKNKKELFFCEEVTKFTFNIIVKQVLSLEPEEARSTQIKEDFLTFMKGLISPPIYIPGTPYAKAVKARKRIHSTIKGIITERTKENVKRGDYFDFILYNSSLNDQEKVYVILDLLLGGYETTTLLISMIIYFLGHSPLALQKLKEEHQAVRQRKTEGALDWEDYKQMEFTKNVIDETLRCGNIVKFVHRKAIKDVDFKGYLIPAGWKVLPMFAAVHLNSSFHENATEFNPWRWNKQVKGKAYTPFSGGLRLCPGADLGKVEAAIFLHHLLLNFRWNSLEVDYPISHPYVAFEKGLPIEIEALDEMSKVKSS